MGTVSHLNMGSIRVSLTALGFLALAVLGAQAREIADYTDEEIQSWQGPGLLRRAAKKGNLADVRQLVERGVNVNGKDSFGYSALHEAASRGHLEVVKYLHSQGADILTHDNGLTTPLWLAAYKGNLPMVEYLADNGAPLDTPRAWFGLFPLNAAADQGNVDVVRFLIERGADVDKKCEDFGSKNGEQSSLEIARSQMRWARGTEKSKYEEIVTLLTDAGAQDTNLTTIAKGRMILKISKS